jgi:4-aminobutyrate aminotransferase/(S)-3-amino-2-methylpropionate transaminase
MLAIELVEDPGTKSPATDLAQAVVDAALQRGLLLIRAGVYGNCIRVLCPLTIEEPVLDEALGVWEQSLAEVLG